MQVDEQSRLWDQRQAGLCGTAGRPQHALALLVSVAWHGMAWQGAAWHGMAGYSMAWYRPGGCSGQTSTMLAGSAALHTHHGFFTPQTLLCTAL